MSFVIIAAFILGFIGLFSSIVLYICSKKFAIYEDPRTAGLLSLAFMGFSGVDNGLKILFGIE